MVAIFVSIMGALRATKTYFFFVTGVGLVEASLLCVFLHCVISSTKICERSSNLYSSQVKNVREMGKTLNSEF